MYVHACVLVCVCVCARVCLLYSLSNILRLIFKLFLLKRNFTIETLQLFLFLSVFFFFEDRVHTMASLRHVIK